MDPIWLFFRITSDKGIEYKVNIHYPTAYNAGLGDGPARELGATSPGFVLEYDAKAQDPFMPIIGSKVTFTLITGSKEYLVDDAPNAAYQENGYVQVMLNLLQSANEGRFTVTIRKDPDGDDTLFWAGVIIPEQTKLANAPLPQEVSITAVDDLANLYKVPYDDDGTPYSGAESFKNGMLKILAKTRCQHAWSGTADFLYSQRYFNSAAAIADSSADPYDYHRYVADDMVEGGGGNGDQQVLSCGDVLEGMARVFMASVFQSEGVWWFMPRLCLNNSPLYSVNKWQRDGTLIAANSPINALFTIGTGAGNARILSGGSDTYLHPIRAAEVEYKFRGSLPVVQPPFTWTPYADIVGEVYTNTLFTSVSGAEFNTIFHWRVEQEADGTRTGAARAIRYKMIVRFKVGTKYLKRSALQSGNIVFSLADGTAMSVFNPFYASNGLLWTDTATDRWEFYTQAIDARFGDSVQGNFYMNSPDLPSDQEGIEIELEAIEAYHADGTTSTAITNAALADSNMELYYATYIIGNADTAQDSVVFRGDFDNDAREVLELDTALFGDQVSTLNTKGSIRRSDNTTYTGQEWKRPGDASELFINQLLVKTYAQHRHRSALIRIFTIYHTSIYFHSVPFYETDLWFITSYRLQADKDEYELEIIDAELTGTITVAQADRYDGIPNPAGNSGGGTGIGLEQGMQAVGNQVAAISERSLTLQPLGVGGVDLRSSEGSSDRVRYAPRAGINADVTLPTQFVWFLVAASRLSNTDERYLSLVLNNNYPAQENDAQFIAPIDGEFTTTRLLSNVTDDITVKIYKNSVLFTTVVVAVTSGTVASYDFSGNEFDAGDVLAFTVQSDTAPADVNVTIGLLAK